MSSLVPVLIPQPQQITPGTGSVHLVKAGTLCCCIVVPVDAADFELVAANVIRSAIGAATCTWPKICKGEPQSGLLPIWVGESARPVLEHMPAPSGKGACDNESYVLHIDTQGIALRGVGGAGTMYAAHTMTQLLTVKGAELTIPALTIRDWPHFNYRGLYVESKWGPDLMTLTDWQHLIDKMASLKMNLLGVGVYGCWAIQYDQSILEFLMTPLRQHPDLHTPKTITYYSSRRGGWQSLCYLPAMFEKDFFGDVVAYGKMRNVMVRPHFNSLGHNTLLPRLRPDISARDTQGWPKGYGFCLSSPATVKTMSGILQEIVERYLRPSGVDHFHLGLDEVWDQVGVYPHNPQQKVSPWCECALCSSSDRHTLLTQYVIALIKELKAMGIRNITLWHDQLAKMGLLRPEFVSLLEENGLEDNVIINWWHYNPQPISTIHPELNLRRFVTPMAGYYFWTPYRSTMGNIEGMSRLGVEQGAEGIEAYCTYDEAFDNHQRLLAECAWNPDSVNDLPAWLEKYAQYVFGQAWQEGRAALHAFEMVTSPGSCLNLVLQLDAYRYTYVAADKDYPRQYPEEALRSLAAEPTSASRLSEAVQLAADARRQLEALLVAGIPQYALAEQLVAEAGRIEGLLRIFTALLDVKEQYTIARKACRSGLHIEATTALQQAQLHLAKAMRMHDQVSLQMESIKASYLLPQLLRNWSSIRPFLVRLGTFLETQADVLAQPNNDGVLPDLEW